MKSADDNRGPEIEDATKLRWVKVNIAELLHGMNGMSMEERGFYVTGFFEMYARDGRLPYGETDGSRIFHLQARTYRRLRDLMVDTGKFIRVGDWLINKRVNQVIAEFCRETRRRQEAALEREARKREALKSEDSAEKPSVYPEKSAKNGNFKSKLETKFGSNAVKKPSEINVCDATAVPSQVHSRGGTINQEPLTKNQDKNRTHSHLPSPVDTPREGEEDFGHGVFVNCTTVRHRDFSISIAGIDMQLATAAIDMTPAQRKAAARDGAIAHALQWASEIENGKRPDKVVPSHPANFIRGAIVGQLNKSAHVARGSRAAQSTTAKQPTVTDLLKAAEQDAFARHDTKIISVEWSRS